MNLIDVTQQFRTDDDCLAYLESMRWPDGIRCPVCGCDKISTITRKAGTVTRGKTAGEARKNRRTRIYQCLEETCKQQFSATAGTIFNDSHLSLTKWFMALALIVDAKKGVSAKQLQEHLGIGSYRTAWYMAHRIRKAMENNGSADFSGIIEMDETYLGGVKHGRKYQGRRDHKQCIVGIKQRGGGVRFFHAPDIYVDGNTTTNGIESAFSLFKRGVIGSFRKISIKHLHRYLSEFETRFNARKADDRFNPTLRRMLGVEPMPYAELIAEK